MTTSAFVMMVGVWAVVIFFAGYFLLRVLTTPQKLDPDAEDGSGAK